MAQPRREVAAHTICVKWPVALLYPGLLYEYCLYSSYLNEVV